MGSHQRCLAPTPLSQLMQEIALKIAQETSPPVPQPIFHLHGGLMDAAGPWLLSPPLAMEQTHPAQRFLHPVPPRRNCISYHTNQRQMNYTSYLNIFVPLKALPRRTDAGTRPCAPVPEV